MQFDAPERWLAKPRFKRWLRRVTASTLGRLRPAASEHS